MSTRRFWFTTLGGLMLLTLCIGWATNRYFIEQRIALASERLMLLSNLRREALHRYLDTAEAELRFWSINQELIDQQLWLVDAWSRAVQDGRDPEARLKLFYVENNPYPPGERRKFNDAGDGSGYSGLHAKLHPLASLFVSERGYYDFFLISPTGDILYTVEKEDDFATNLYQGEFKDSGLAEVFKRALVYAETDQVAISDLSAYAPSGGTAAMFVAKAMYGEEGQLAGVIAFQLPTDRIVDIMNFDGGMGRTGETYLVGEDLLMRSDSRFSDDSSILAVTVATKTVARALLGEYGVEFIEDYRGVEVLSAYSSTRIGETTWAVIAEVDKAEILENATSDRPMLAGLMLFFYSFAAWSVWYIQRADVNAEGISLLADLDLDGGMDLSDG
jgi:methyl-accepting chemotaxis protein